MHHQTEQAISRVRKALEKATSRFVGCRAGVLLRVAESARESSIIRDLISDAAGVPPRKVLFVERPRLDHLLAQVEAEPREAGS